MGDVASRATPCRHSAPGHVRTALELVAKPVGIKRKIAKDFTTFEKYKKKGEFRKEKVDIPCLFRKNLTVIGTGSIG